MTEHGDQSARQRRIATLLPEVFGPLNGEKADEAHYTPDNAIALTTPDGPLFIHMLSLIYQPHPEPHLEVVYCLSADGVNPNPNYGERVEVVAHFPGEEITIGGPAHNLLMPAALKPRQKLELLVGTAIHDLNPTQYSRYKETFQAAHNILKSSP